MEILKIGIVEDDPETLRFLRELAEQVSGIRVVLTAQNGMEAVNKLMKITPDVLILDVEIPEMSGLEVLKQVNPVTRVVLCSAHRNYAYDGFEQKVANFLLKPFSKGRFVEVISDLRKHNHHAVLNGVMTGHDYFIVSEMNGQKNVKVNFEDIIYLEAKDGGVNLIMAESKLFIQHALKDVYCLLPKNQFVRISYSFVISTDYYQHYHDGKVKLRYVKNPLTVGGKNMSRDFQYWLSEYAL
ncbi:hypothetical protein GCM10023231_00510 [Olivibacter ginsenosidimutans]|uniref:Response regulatory domain-containing protein n=1 Tax=Olivibacter ginsenosidimutans TaxID=1176537 RepID=A0ABP9ABQ0_9SPHI